MRRALFCLLLAVGCASTQREAKLPPARGQVEVVVDPPDKSPLDDPSVQFQHR